MSRETLSAAIPAGSRIILDTSALLAYLDGNEAASPAANLVLDGFVQSGRNPATISAISVAEVLGRPFRASAAAVGTTEAFLRHSSNLDIVDIDYETACEAARIRAETNLRAPDAIVIATALIQRCQIVVANDERWKSAVKASAPSLALCYLDAHIPIDEPSRETSA